MISKSSKHCQHLRFLLKGKQYLCRIRKTLDELLLGWIIFVGVSNKVKMWSLRNNNIYSPKIAFCIKTYFTTINRFSRFDSLIMLNLNIKTALAPGVIFGGLLFGRKFVSANWGTHIWGAYIQGLKFGSGCYSIAL